MAGLDLPAASREVIEDCLAVIDAIQVPIDRLDVEVHARAKADPRVKVLTRLPGVGNLTALVILAEIGDVGRFGSARKLAAWAGLTPTVRASDRTVRYGHISKQGSTWLRWILCVAAQTAKRSPEFAATYQAIAHRRGKKIATTAIARKLLTRAYHLLVDVLALATAACVGTKYAPDHRPSLRRQLLPHRLLAWASNRVCVEIMRRTPPRCCPDRVQTCGEPTASVSRADA